MDAPFCSHDQSYRGSRVAKPLERLREWEREGTGEKREMDEGRKRDRRQEKQIYCFLQIFLSINVIR